MTGALAAARRVLLNRRAVGRVVMGAAVVAFVTCLVGIVVAWRLVGGLERSADDSLEIVGDTLATVQDTLTIADTVIEDVRASMGTVRGSMDTLSASVGDGAESLQIFADLTETIPPNLDRIDDALGGLESTAAIVDDTLGDLSRLPLGPDYDPDEGLADAIAGVRGDLDPISESLRSSTGPLRRLAESSDELTAQLDTLARDLDAITRSLDDSRALIDRYQTAAGEAATVAADTRSRLGGEVGLSRALTVVLGLTIAIGQVAPFRIGQELARGRTVEPPA